MKFKALLALSFLFSTLAIGQQVDMELFKNMKPRNVGPAGMSGRIASIDVVQSNPDIIYAGAASGGLWRSENGGTTWEPIFENEKAASIGAVAVNQNNPDEIWVGTGEGNPRNSQTSGYGIFKSIDRGKTWKHMGLEKTRNIHRVIIHPSDPNTVYVGSQGSAWNESTERGVYRTTNGGGSWERILYVDQKTGIADLVLDPNNPNKLMAAMWEFRRWPYFFKSGGPGSGLYITYDGGDNWKKQGEKDGIPKEELGRIGLSFATSNPKVAYAFIETKKDGFYRSDDGGNSWNMVSAKGNFGNRPFYYADIYVDPSNENNIFSIHSNVTWSQDGGKTWSNFVDWGAGVHPDHQSFYINPGNPKHIITCNDGGIAITRDQGKNWTFVENLPLGQFYHINVDNDLPYHIYGGMQDNGSWRGPGYTWQYSGIMNAEWNSLFGGDGFDVVPDPDNSRWGYAMWQGGNLGRYDVESGQALTIKPIHPDGEKLRFNWNAGIAQDPFDAGTIYYGSQYLHKSTDRGRNWTIISPDLTTNDPEKQKQAESGGLTPDVTDAENYTSIISIAPSPKKKGVIWVGTDDGNIQMTSDGGTTWTNFTPKIKGLAKNCWVPHIEPSKHNENEVFVILNNYRQGDWTPYVYHSSDMGKSWQNLAAGKDVWGYALSIVQDPVQPNLLFLGTEFHLYVSFDKGANWNRWTEGYPTVSTMDLKIQEREADLIIGTFGRAAWVIDDISPLRGLAADKGMLGKELVAFKPPIGYNVEMSGPDGYFAPTNNMFAGDNRGSQARIRYYVREGKKADAKKGPKPESGEKKEEDKKAKPEKGANPDSVYVRVYEGAKLIRTMRQYPDSGLNEINWNYNEKGPYWPGWEDPDRSQEERAGNFVKPGTYKLELSYGASKANTEIEVRWDPRLNLSAKEIDDLIAIEKPVEKLIGQTAKIMDELRDMKKEIDKVEKLLPKEDEKDTSLAALKREIKVVKDSVNKLMEMVMGPRETKGISPEGDNIWQKVASANGSIYSALDPPGQNQVLQLAQAKMAYDKGVVRVNNFINGPYVGFKKNVADAKLNPFSERGTLPKAD